MKAERELENERRVQVLELGALRTRKEQEIRPGSESNWKCWISRLCKFAGVVGDGKWLGRNLLKLQPEGLKGIVITVRLRGNVRLGCGSVLVWWVVIGVHSLKEELVFFCWVFFFVSLVVACRRRWTLFWSGGSSWFLFYEYSWFFVVRCEISNRWWFINRVVPEGVCVASVEET